MAPKARAKSVPKAKGKAKAEPAAKPKAKGKAAASAKASSSASRASPAPAATTPEEVPPAPAVAEAAPTAAVASTAPAAEATAPTHAAEPEVPAAVPVEPPTVRGQKLQDSTPDPWASLSDDEALAKVTNEAWDQILDDVGACSDAVGAAHLAVKDAGHKDLPADSGLARVAVSLDFSENALERIDALPALWIRNLLLGNNPLQSFDALNDLFPRLIAIDLSFVDIPSIDGAWTALAKCQRLRSLVAEGGGVTSFEDMELMVALENLELLENGVEEVEEIETLAARCPSLARLDLRENPVATEPGYAKAIKKHLPKLVWHNNQSLKKYVAKGIDKCGYGNLNAEINAVDGLYKNEHCSCLDGNPCLEPETCIDWEHREGVAAEARKRKGLRDDFGKQL